MEAMIHDFAEWMERNIGPLLISVTITVSAAFGLGLYWLYYGV